MAEEKKKQQTMVSPMGVARWPHLTSPYPKPNSDDVQYSVDLELDPQKPENKAFLVKIKKMAIAEAGEGCHIPFKKAKDPVTEEPTGKYLVKFASGPDYPPALFDKYGEPLNPADTTINAGSVIVVSSNPSAWDVGGRSGLKLYLQAVVVLEAAEFSHGDVGSYGLGSFVEERSELNDENVPDFLNQDAGDLGEPQEPEGPGGGEPSFVNDDELI